MIAAVVALALATSAADAAALGGIDDVPVAALVDGVPSAQLWAVVVDATASTSRRCRAVRLLGARKDVEAAALHAVADEAKGELRVQARLAAWQRTASDDVPAVVAAAQAALSSSDAATAVVALFFAGGDAARAALVDVEARHPDPHVRASARGRLARFGNAGVWARPPSTRTPAPAVVPPRDGRPSPAPRRELQHPEHVPAAGR